MNNDEKLNFYDYYFFMVAPLLTMLLSSLISLILMPVGLTSMNLALPETGYGIAGYAFYAFLFIILAVIAAFGIYLLIKKDLNKVLQYFLGFAIAFSTTIITYVYLDYILSFYGASLLGAIEVGTLLVAGVVGVVTAYVVISRRVKTLGKNLFLGFYSILVSSFLALIIPSWTLIFLLIGISLYDIYSVRKGPIKGVIELSEKRGTIPVSLTVIVGPWEIGVGDLVFYSMLVCHTLLFYGVLVWFFTLIGLIFGLILTLVALIKSRLLPGLPLAIFFGLIPLVTTVIVSII